MISREHIWMLSKVPDLDKFKYVIKDAEKLDLVEEVGQVPLIKNNWNFNIKKMELFFRTK